MTWLNEEFPPCIAYGAQSAPVWMTTIVGNQGGYEQRNQNWTQARHEFDLSFAIRTQTDYAMVLKHWHMARGQLHSFGITDPLDNEASTAEGVVAYIAPGVTQLLKRYGSGLDAWDRKITRPKPGVVIYRDGSPATPGGGAGQYAVDVETGRVTFVPDQARAVTAHTPGATHVVSLATAFSPALTAGGKLRLAGVTGTAALILNGIEHLVLAVAGLDVTLQVSTTGLTANGGTASLLAQAAELAWSGQFMVPVRYGMDRMPAIAVNRQSPEELLVSVDGVSLVEVRE